ncbi:MAG: hypothetical protein LQ350_002062 [Teloschistes chrysophthalmus]|nr:MAG: hypothetical protein LQ350_002062 [Niorma chrysophthalma]
MGDPFTPSIGFVVSTAKFFAQLNAVKDETGVVLNQVKVVTNDVVEAERLYLIKRLYLSDGDQSRIEEVIKHTRLAVNRIAKEVEPARKSMKKIGTIDGFHRVDWILRKSASTETYQHSLETCHRSLLDRMSMLRGVQSDTGSHPTSMESSNASVEESLESDETDDAPSSSSSDLDGYDATEDMDTTASPVPEIASTTKEIHPERALYEASQQNHARKFQKGKSAVHPERLRYEEMQQRQKVGINSIHCQKK